MSYQVLARKWRPSRFSEVVGQKHVLTALENGLKENRLHHAYLFSGTRGVGKTSIARLFAKGLNCETGITAEPCGKCENCLAIEQGNFVDLIEIDAASRTKVEDTREVLDNVQYKPVRGRFKVYLIDEVHMLSRHSFNALLKTLEEPPEYVKFLLATTDPQKLPITVLSRCMQFHLKALEQMQISQHLANILKQEHIEYEMTALDKLAKAAKGSVRDSLSLTDQAIAVGGGTVTVENVNAMLGLLDNDQAIELIYALAQADGEKVMAQIDKIAEKGADWEQLLIEVAEQLHKIAMLQLLSSTPPDSTENLLVLARSIAPEDVQFYYQMMILGRKELAISPNQRMGVEMTMLRALAFHPKNIHSETVTQTTSGSLAESAVQNSIKEVPVVPSRTTKEHADNAINDVKNTQTTAINSALATIQNLRSLGGKEQPLSTVNDSEKKNVDLSTTSELRAKPIPVASSKMSSSDRLMERLASIGQNSSKQQKEEQENKDTVIVSAEENEINDEGELNPETYRWEWSNPEMAQNGENALKPSEIKQAILEERTAELKQKLAQLGTERDEWYRIIKQLGLETGLVRQLAINSVLLSKENGIFQLGLRSNQQHLNTETNVNILKGELGKLYDSAIALQVELYDEQSLLTPLELSREIYQELVEQSKQALLQDKKLQQLREEFDAEFELDTVRPVG